MGCAVCGEQVSQDARFCSACGSLLAAPTAVRSTTTTQESEGAAFSPTQAPLPATPRATRPTEESALRSWSSGRSPRVALLVIAFALLVSVGMTPLLARVASRQTAAGADSCPGAVNVSAARAITQVTLTTALRTVDGTYAPRAPTTTFTAGQSVYVTFLVVTPATGRLDMRVCIGSRVIGGALAVPAGSAGHSGEFTTQLPASLARGPGAPRSGVAVLLWNGVVAARIPFLLA